MANTWLTTEAARKTLQSYRDRIAEIISVIPSDRELARAAAKNLKADVKSYYKRPARSRESMSQIESSFFDPCMHRVFVALQKLNLKSNPGPVWLRALYDADSELGHWLFQLDQKPRL